MTEIQFVPDYVKTRNVRNFDVLMDALAMNVGEGCFGAASGRAGLGKTETTTRYAASHGCAYMEVLRIYVKSELEFLKGICRALDIKKKFGRKGDAFMAAAEAMKSLRKPLFIDEMDQMPQWGIEVARDLTKFAKATVVLIGEEELIHMMQQNRRVWSRTFQYMEFIPIDVTDVMLYCSNTTGLKLSPKVGAILHEACDGDFRLVKRALIQLVKFANAKSTDKIDMEMAKIAVKTGLKG